MEKKIKVLMDLIKNEVSGLPVDPAPFLALTEDEQREILSLAKQHSVVPLLGDALGRTPETAGLELVKPLVQNSLVSLSYTVKLDAERKRTCAVLDQAKIPYICLKGARIRPYYPKPWMRTSCDNDILVHEADVDRGAELLVEQLGYRYEFKNYHDISLYSKSNAHLELHFSIKEDMEKMDRVLSQVWEHSSPVPHSSGYEYEQSPEFFMFHLIAHMAYHFVEGGCGIRAFVDLFLMEDKLSYQDETVISFCQQAGIANFYKNVKQLVNVWFRNGTHTPVTQQMEEYIFSGGTFGSYQNHMAVTQEQMGGQKQYLLRRIFMPTQNLCERYPSLERHKWLAPLYQVRRWFSALFSKDSLRIRHEVQTSCNIGNSSSKLEQMLRENDML